MYHCSIILVNIILLYVRHFNSENTIKANERDILTIKIQLKRSKNVKKKKQIQMCELLSHCLSLS